MQTATTALARWLQNEMNKRGLTQMNAASEIGVGTGTISDILRRGHIPKIETLFRIADHFDTPRDRVLRLAADLPAQPAGPDADPYSDYLVQELVQEFRKVPDEWKEEALAQVEMFVRLANLPTVRFVGDEELNPEPQEPADDDQKDQETQAA